MLDWNGDGKYDLSDAVTDSFLFTALFDDNEDNERRQPRKKQSGGQNATPLPPATGKAEAPCATGCSGMVLLGGLILVVLFLLAK